MYNIPSFPSCEADITLLTLRGRGNPLPHLTTAIPTLQVYYIIILLAPHEPPRGHKSAVWVSNGLQLKHMFMLCKLLVFTDVSHAIMCARLVECGWYLKSWWRNQDEVSKNACSLCATGGLLHKCKQVGVIFITVLISFGWNKHARF